MEWSGVSEIGDRDLSRSRVKGKARGDEEAIKREVRDLEEQTTARSLVNGGRDVIRNAIYEKTSSVKKGDFAGEPWC